MTSNVARLFFEAAERDADATAFVTADGTSIRFGELRRRVENFAGGLGANGFRAGDRAVFMLAMSPELYVGVLGALAAGGVAIFVDPWVSLQQIARLAAAAKPAAFIGSPKAHVLRLLSPELRRVRLTVSTDALGASLAARLRFSELAGRSAIADVSPDAPALITYTTGSSGQPKGVNRTHAILAAQHHVIREEFPARPGDVDLTTFPVFALSNLASGITTVIPPVDLRRVSEADGGAVLAAMSRAGVTTAAASPPLFDRVAEHLHSSGGQPPALRRIVTGGAPVTDAQLRRWREAYPSTEIVVAYGSSEAEPVASMTAEQRRAAGSRRGYCVGRPVAAARTRVTRITRGPLSRIENIARGEVGELLVAGPHVCRDYVDDAAAFAENKVRDTDGTVWHRMGDTGCFDAEGRFWLVGRVHSTIRRAGVDLHAQLVEQAARGDDARIRRIAALGVPQPDIGERLMIIAESETAGVAEGIRARLLADGTPIDDLIVTRTSLPVDPRHNSKIDYGRLREMLAAGTLR